MTPHTEIANPAAKRDPSRDVRKTNGFRRRELFDRVLREEDVCWICRQRVDKSLRGVRVYNQAKGTRPLHPMSPSLDEIDPVSAGGDPLDRANVHLAHLVCNESRGDRASSDRRWFVPLNITAPKPKAGGGRAERAASGPATRASRDWSS